MAERVISPPEVSQTSPLEHSRRQLEALLEVSEAIAQQRDLTALFHDLAVRLHSVIEFDFLSLVLHDTAKNVMRLHVLETHLPSAKRAGAESAIEGNPAGWVWQTQKPFIVSDTDKETRFPDFLPRYREHNVRSLAILPLTTAQHRLGAMGFGRVVPHRLSDTELQFMQRVASQVAVAVDNTLNLESSQAYQKQLARERDRFRVLLEVNNVLISSRELPELFPGIVSTLERVIHHDYTSLALFDPASKTLRIYAFYFPSNQNIFKPDTVVPLENTPAGRAITTGQPFLARGAELDHYPSEIVRILRAEGLQAVCCVPLVHRDRTFGTLNLASRRADTFTPGDVELLQPVGAQIAIAVENALAFKEIDALKDKLAVEKLYLEEEIRSELNFEEIVGESSVLKRALGQVELAAPAATTVLLLGETGTGKELFARAIHNLSPRRDRTFVKINCAAIPSGLLESELFGHEKGAFTGAINQKIGRFELADRGTLFLDEVGDIPLELQPKLLRVLQEQEFERLGGTRTVRVDVRLIAATNRDLEEMVAEKQFREDLYFRLNVFPIRIPPLRERSEDISLLVQYYVDKYSQRMNKRIDVVPEETMAGLCRYSWPGNIRELQNLIERAVIMTPGNVLQIQVSDLQESNRTLSNMAGTLEDVERQRILQALREAGAVIGGPHGAAVRLGLKRTTLLSKMQKLGISRNTNYTPLTEKEASKDLPQPVKR